MRDVKVCTYVEVNDRISTMWSPSDVYTPDVRIKRDDGTVVRKYENKKPRMKTHQFVQDVKVG